VYLPSAGRVWQASCVSVRTSQRTGRPSRTYRYFSRLCGEWKRRRPSPRRIPSPARPRSVPLDAVGTALAVAGGCRAVEAARDALPHPVHAAFVTVAHGRLEAPMDRIGLLRRYGLLAQTGCCRDRPARLRGLGTRGRHGWPPAALSQDRSVALAGREPCGRPVVAAFGRARPRGQRRIGLGPVGVALAGCPRFAPRADVAAPEAAVAPVRFVSHALAACGHAPGPRTGAPVQASVRGFSGVARTGRSNVAARGGAGLVAGGIIAESGGVWQRPGGGAAGNCANAGSARHVVGLASGGLGQQHAGSPFGGPRSAPGAGKRSAPGASYRDPNGPRPLAGSVAERDRARARRAALKR